VLDVRPDEEKASLLRLAVTAGSIANSRLSGMERGSLITLMLVLQALIQDDAPSESFAALRKGFEGFPCDTPELRTLYDSFLKMCDLALAFDEDAAHILSHELLRLVRRDKAAN
jgi:hypothetical protein